MGWGNESLFKWAGSHDQYGHHTHICRLATSPISEFCQKWPANVLYLIAHLVKIMVSPVICLYNSTLKGGVYKSFGFQCTFTQKHSEEIFECSCPESLCKV